MPDALTHPTPQQLTAFGLGKLPEALAATVAGHLQTCPACRLAVEKVPADSFLGKLQAAKPGRSALPPSPSSTRVAGAPTTPKKAASVAPPENVPPELANYSKYRIVRELGRGGMGVVYQAVQTVMDRPVGIKVINPSVLEHADALPRFHAEVKAAAKLDHPNIVRAFDAEQVGNLHLLVMEFVEGVNLAELVQRKGPLPVANACHFVRQAALGLQHAFEQQMVHRDIKPQNLMVTPRGVVKILDFGLARLRSERATGGRLTQVNAFMGTPEYVSPEQSMDARTADTRADLYSLGCTLYFLLTGRPPFQGDMAVELVLAHIEQEPPALHELRADVPPTLSAVVARLLAKKPAERYQKPVELALALVPFIKRTKMDVAAVTAAAAGVASPGKATMMGGDTRQFDRLGRDASKLTAHRAAAKEEKKSPFEDLVEAPAKRAKKTRVAAWYRRPLRLAGVGAAVLALGLGACLLAGFVFKTKVKTADGEAFVVLEVDQPGAEVLVDGQKITVAVPGDNQPVQIKVDPGRHRLRIGKDGFEVVTRDVELKMGRSDAIRVRLEPVRVAGVQPPEVPKDPVPTPLKPPVPPQDPVPTPVGTSQQELGRLLARAKDPAVNREQLRDDTIDFCLKYRGQPQAYQAGALLPQLPPLENSIGMKLAPIPPGKFLMGSPEGEDGRYDDEGQHEVEITKPFYMGKYDVTRGEFRQFIDETGYDAGPEWRNPPYVKQADDHPVVCVNWKDAEAFCDWLTKKEGNTYRLPTEAQWEYSCRAGTTTRFYSGDDDSSLKAVANSGSGNTTPVGQFKPNAFGLCDMHGNVSEICGDWYKPDYYKDSPPRDPQGPTAHSWRVARGGSFRAAPRLCRSANRCPLMGAGARFYDRGFRVVLVR